ncbi:uncharacterized protein J4E79_011395 [Alternaria viburni]|uniref:uncharacterized protein n=1 Tax=Alternaria viburni TaxID=566460 RepID=UPI0020C2B11B|nr:uncharacterized protein J4E79_011395 [Alternaria viburni]KAI4642779.1 hypothetical protein J4E79_011395 [Alternaria viburni]
MAPIADRECAYSVDHYDPDMLANDADQPPIDPPVDAQCKDVQHSPTQPEPHYPIFRPRKVNRSQSLSLPPRRSRNPFLPSDPFSRLHYLSLAISTELEALNLLRCIDNLQHLRTHPALRHKAKKQHRNKHRPSTIITKTKTKTTQKQTSTDGQTQEQTQEQTKKTYTLNAKAAACGTGGVKKCKYGTYRVLDQQGDDVVDRVCKFHKSRKGEDKRGEACQ